MKVYYQWIIWSYSFVASDTVSKHLNIKIHNEDIIWLSSFGEVWKLVSNNNDAIWVLPIENSYAGSVHENVYNFLDYNNIIFGEYDMPIDHCLLSNEKSIFDIKQVYSHRQALSQCQDFIKKQWFEPIKYQDTALSAKYISSNNISNAWAIASSMAWQLYGLNILAKHIQDQEWNTTKFILIKNKNNKCNYKIKKNKISILFSVKDKPASLYKCLGSFATNWINLTKIESMSDKSDLFSYMFFISLNWKMSDKNIQDSLEEMKFWTTSLNILWEY